MIDKKKKFNFKYLLIYILTILCLFSSLSGLVVNISNAEDIEYSNVLEDLQKDENFNIENFPVIENDNTLKLITIAESSDKDLLIYVYQPSQKYTATSINISFDEDNKLKYTNFKLELLDKNGVFSKYKLVDYEVNQNLSYRYYEISNIYRPFDSSVDDEIDNDNSISEKGFNVGKSFVFVGGGDNLTVHVQDVETIEITSKYVGFLRYSGGIQPPWSMDGDLDAHFVAFSTDKNIDKLMEADIYYCSQDYFYSTEPILGIINEEYGEIKEDYSYIKSDDFVDWTGNGWFSEKYTFERIQTVSEFFKDEKIRDYTYSAGIFNVCTQSKLTDEAFDDIKQMSWVLRFAETSYIQKTVGSVNSYFGTTVSDVSILRLKFLSEGKVYNLGVVDNKQSGSGIPDNIINQWLELPSWLRTVIIILIIIVAVILLVVFFPVIWPVILVVLKFILNCIIWLFKGLYWLFIKAPMSLFNKE